jgi:hypothetical protein
MTEAETAELKRCAVCEEMKPVTDFMRRTGRRARKHSRRGSCRTCRKTKNVESSPVPIAAAPTIKKLVKPETPYIRPKLPDPLFIPDGLNISELRATRQGIVRMRGKTDKGRRWVQETDLETALVLVEEYAAVVVNRHTIRRIYSNKTFRNYILSRDRYTCYFCGQQGDTIDHLLPRAKGGHTTPINCVCACQVCNQSKADRSVEDFMNSLE